MCCLDDNYRKNGALAGLFIIGNSLASFYLIVSFLLITDGLCRYLLFVFSSFSIMTGFLTIMAVVRMSELLRRDVFLRRLILLFIVLGFILVPLTCWRLFVFMANMEETTVGGKVANDRSLAVYCEIALIIFHGILSCFIICAINEAKATRLYYEREAKYSHVAHTQISDNTGSPYAHRETATDSSTVDGNRMRHGGYHHVPGDSQHHHQLRKHHHHHHHHHRRHKHDRQFLYVHQATKGPARLDDDEGGSNASFGIDDAERRSEDIESYSDNLISDEESERSNKHLTQQELRERGLLAPKQKKGLGRKNEDSDFYDEEIGSLLNSRKRSSEGSSALLLAPEKPSFIKKNHNHHVSQNFESSRVSRLASSGNHGRKPLYRPESTEPAELELGASDDEARHLEFIEYKSDFNRRPSRTPRSSTTTTLPDLNHGIRNNQKKRGKALKSSRRDETDDEND